MLCLVCNFILLSFTMIKRLIAPSCIPKTVKTTLHYWAIFGHFNLPQPSNYRGSHMGATEFGAETLECLSCSCQNMFVC